MISQTYTYDMRLCNTIFLSEWFTILSREQKINDTKTIQK